MSETTPGRLSGVDGTVKWFDSKKGYGFIIGPEGQDIFVHFSKIEGEGFRSLKDGSPVTYDAALTDKGWQASRVARRDGPEVTVRTPDRSHLRSPRR